MGGGGVGPGDCWSAAGFANIRLQHGCGAGELKCARPGVGLAGGPPGNQGGVACGVGLSVGCMVSKLYEYVFAGAGVGVHASPFGGPPPSSHQNVSTFSSAESGRTTRVDAAEPDASGNCRGGVLWYDRRTVSLSSAPVGAKEDPMWRPAIRKSLASAVGSQKYIDAARYGDREEIATFVAVVQSG